MAESPEVLEKTLTALWEGRDDLFAVLPEADARAAILQAVELLDTGDARVAELVDGEVPGDAPLEVHRGHHEEDERQRRPRERLRAADGAPRRSFCGRRRGRSPLLGAALRARLLPRSSCGAHDDRL